MTATDAVRALAAAADSLVAEGDAQETLARLIDSCRTVLDADAAGIMVSADGGLELLGSSSHAVAELDLFQIQIEQGPCVDTIRNESPVSAQADEIRKRWTVAGARIADAGYRVVRAYPLRWHGRVLGGLNVLWRQDTDDPAVSVLGQAFADLTALLLMRRLDEGERETTKRIEETIAGRAVIEQAKGVLAHRYQLDMGPAYERLVQDARRQAISLTAAAEALVHRSHGGET